MSKPAMQASVVAVLLMARPASAEVIVNVHLAKPEFIVGEPIHVVVDVKNVGPDVLLLQSCCAGVTVTVPSGKRRVLPSFDTCHPLGDMSPHGAEGDRRVRCDLGQEGITPSLEAMVEGQPPQQSFVQRL